MLISPSAKCRLPASMFITALRLSARSCWATAQGQRESGAVPPSLDQVASEVRVNTAGHMHVMPQKIPKM